METRHLPGEQARAKWMRIDAAEMLKRFFFCERMLVIAQASWIACLASVEIKTTLARFLWEDAQTAEALRERVFELRFPSRLMEIGEDAALIDLFARALHAPNASAFLLGLSRALKPALLHAFRAYLELSDPIADGPTQRFLQVAVGELEAQIEQIEAWGQASLVAAPEERQAATGWTADLRDRLQTLVGAGSFGGGIESGDSQPLVGERAYSIPAEPARDSRFRRVRFYWPDIISDYPYGEGLRLQLRSAISHLNEVWAVETAGIILYAFADRLGWEFIRQAARWTYDEGRHCLMGYRRLLDWGFDPQEIPLGSYIYDSARGQDPIYRLGMLFYFETKNIGKKNSRARAFAGFHDNVSQHDMEFDWADETIHAGYGKHWLSVLLADAADEPEDLRRRCGYLVEATVASATDEEVIEISEIADALVEKAERIAIGQSA